VWLEITLPPYDELNDPTIAMMIGADDDMFQCGESIHFFHVRNPTTKQQPRDVQIAPITTRFDLTKMLDAIRDGASDTRDTFMQGRSLRDGWTGDSTLTWQKQLADGTDWTGFLGFLIALSLPKTLIEKEDHSAYNQTQRRLQRHNKQRQEYHTVRISLDDRDIVFVGGETREGNHTPRGEHDVRGHIRTYRSGRVVWVRPHKRGEGPVKSHRVGYELVPPSTILPSNHPPP
jgi:hypothetical protein